MSNGVAGFLWASKDLSRIEQILEGGKAEINQLFFGESEEMNDSTSPSHHWGGIKNDSRHRVLVYKVFEVAVNEGVAQKDSALVTTAKYNELRIYKETGMEYRELSEEDCAPLLSPKPLTAKEEQEARMKLSKPLQITWLEGRRDKKEMEKEEEPEPEPELEPVDSTPKTPDPPTSSRREGMSKSMSSTSPPRLRSSSGAGSGPRPTAIGGTPASTAIFSTILSTPSSKRKSPNPDQKYDEFQRWKNNIEGLCDWDSLENSLDAMFQEALKEESECFSSQRVAQISSARSS